MLVGEGAEFVSTRRVLVAMSGGVDSSVAAASLYEEGYEVIGVGLRLPETPETGAACCGVAGLRDARRVAARIGIPFYTLDYREPFRREIMAPFGRAYGEGRTPNPCIRCNTRLKFGRLLDFARALDAHYLASGHYARVERGENGAPRLRRGVDSRHDQSYFLYALTPQQLVHILFPLGGLTKKQVREIAHRWGLPVANKPSSQDICFVGPEGYRAFLARHYPRALRPGPIVDHEGRELGRHKGIGAYTLGQRRGLGIAAEEPLYVTDIDAKNDTIVVGGKEDTFIRGLVVDRMNWIVDDIATGESRRLMAKTRYRGAETPADVRASPEGTLVDFPRPHPIAAPGQAAVFYDGDLVVGGGVVDRPIPASYIASDRKRESEREESGDRAEKAV